MRGTSSRPGLSNVWMSQGVGRISQADIERENKQVTEDGMSQGVGRIREKDIERNSKQVTEAPVHMDRTAGGNREKWNNGGPEGGRGLRRIRPWWWGAPKTWLWGASATTLLRPGRHLGS